MDAYMVRTAGGAPAARGEDACQEQDRVEQDGDMDCDQQPSDDIEPVRDRVRPQTHDKRSANAFGHFLTALATTYDLDAGGPCFP